MAIVSIINQHIFDTDKLPITKIDLDACQNIVLIVRVKCRETRFSLLTAR